MAIKPKKPNNRKMGKLLKGIARGIFKGAKDVLPIPTKEAESREFESMAEFLAQKTTSRGALIFVLVYVVDEIFNLNLFG